MGAFSGSNLIETISIPAGSVLETNCFRQSITRNPYSPLGREKSTHMRKVTFEGKVTINGYALFWGCLNMEKINYLSTELPDFSHEGITSSCNAWSSVNATDAMGYNTRDAGMNLFCVPANATFTESDLDMFTPVVFNPEYCGFTLSKTL